MFYGREGLSNILEDEIYNKYRVLQTFCMCKFWVIDLILYITSIS